MYRFFQFTGVLCNNFNLLKECDQKCAVGLVVSTLYTVWAMWLICVDCTVLRSKGNTVHLVHAVQLQPLKHADRCTVWKYKYSFPLDLVHTKYNKIYKAKAFEYYECHPSEVKEKWGKCIISIDKKLRALKLESMSHRNLIEQVNPTYLIQLCDKAFVNK